jgi:hypothetical protein
MFGNRPVLGRTIVISLFCLAGFALLVFFRIDSARIAFYLLSAGETTPSPCVASNPSSAESCLHCFASNPPPAAEACLPCVVDPLPLAPSSDLEVPWEPKICGGKAEARLDKLPRATLNESIILWIPIIAPVVNPISKVAYTHHPIYLHFKQYVGPAENHFLIDFLGIKTLFEFDCVNNVKEPYPYYPVRSSVPLLLT